MISLIFYITISTVIICILLWYIWGSYFYRYSSERIADKILKKYNKQPNDNQVIFADNGKLIDNNMVSAVVTIRDKNIYSKPISQEIYSLPIKNICSPIDKSCIKL